MAERRSHRHHFLPRFYLAGFTRDGSGGGELEVVDMRTGRHRQGRVSNTAIENDFNRFRGIHDEDVVERWLCRIEGRAATALRSLVSTDQGPIAAGTLDALLFFVAVLALRTPAARDEILEHSSRVTEWMLEMQATVAPREWHERERTAAGISEAKWSRIRDDFKNRRVRVEFPPEEHLAMMVNYCGELYRLLRLRTWAILRVGVDVSCPFVLSDNPVTLYWNFPPNVSPPNPIPYGPGYESTYGQVFVPLTRGIGLLGDWEPRDGTLMQAQVAALNTRVIMNARRFVYAPSLDFKWRRKGQLLSGAEFVAAARQSRHS